MKKTFFIILGLLLNSSFVFANDNNSWSRDFWQRATVEQIEEAVKNGADVNKPVKYGHTPLTLAIENGDLEIIKALINAGADVNAKGAYNEIPIFNAIRKVSKPEITELLVDAGADINIKKNNQTPLDFAIDINSIENIEAIVKNIPSLRLKHSNKYWEEATFEVIKKDVESYYKNEDYKDFLYMAIKNGQGLDTIKFFANNDFSIKDATGRTLLMKAVENNQDLEVIQFLIDNGNDINAQDVFGSRVIDYALTINPVLEEFNSRGSNFMSSGINDKKITSTAILELLIKNKIDLSVINQNKYNMLMYGKNLYHSLFLLDIKLDDKALSKQLAKILVAGILASGADINQKDQFGKTPLAYTMLAKNMELASILIENGADVNIKDNEGLAPLMHLAKSGAKISKQEINYLLDAGADINATDNNNKSAKDYIKETSYCKTNIEECKNLLGLDINIKETETNKHSITASNINDFEAVGLSKGDAIRKRGFVKAQ